MFSISLEFIHVSSSKKPKWLILMYKVYPHTSQKKWNKLYELYKYHYKCMFMCHFSDSKRSLQSNKGSTTYSKLLLIWSIYSRWFLNAEVALSCLWGSPKPNLSYNFKNSYRFGVHAASVLVYQYLRRGLWWISELPKSTTYPLLTNISAMFSAIQRPPKVLS